MPDLKLLEHLPKDAFRSDGFSFMRWIQTHWHEIACLSYSQHRQEGLGMIVIQVNNRGLAAYTGSELLSELVRSGQPPVPAQASTMNFWTLEELEANVDNTRLADIWVMLEKCDYQVSVPLLVMRDDLIRAFLIEFPHMVSPARACLSQGGC